MTGWLIENGFLQGEKYAQIGDWLVRAAENRGIQLLRYGNGTFLPSYDAKGVHLTYVGKGAVIRLPSFVLFWDKDILLARAFEALGVRVYNCADAIAACDDKLETHRLLAGHGIPMPKTIAAPMSFANVGYTNLDFLPEVEQMLGYPFVIKERVGSFGAQVYLAQTRAEAEMLLLQLSGKPLLFQAFIAASRGRDVRIQMVGGTAVAAMLRYNEADFRANVTNGGRMQPYVPTEAQVSLALKACRLLRLDFAGVDLLFGDDGAPLLCEVNSNAHFKNIFDCTGVNAADAILAHIDATMVPRAC